VTGRKTCPACGQRLSAAAFNDSARSADGLARWCRACTNARRRERDRSRPRRPPTTNLAAAIRQGDLAAIRRRIRAGAEPHGGWVCEALREGHLAVAEELLAAGVERTVFTTAAMGDVAGLSRRLRRTPADARLTADVKPGCSGVTPLHMACASDWRAHGPDRQAAQVRVAELLVVHGADVNARARYRNLDEATPLFCACWTSGNVALVRRLLDHGATATDRDFCAALGHFQRHGRGAFDLADTLLARGLLVDGSVRGDRTPLQAASHQGNREVVSWLLARGAAVNARGPGRRTAAHFAAERNTGPATLAVLVEHGADLAARDADGCTPLDLARLNGKVRLVGWLERR
jgi:hypothetical protein